MSSISLSHYVLYDSPLYENRQLRVYLIGDKNKKRIRLQIGDSAKNILGRMQELLKIDGSTTKFIAKVHYRGVEITSEGKVLL